MHSRYNYDRYDTKPFAGLLSSWRRLKIRHVVTLLNEIPRNERMEFFREVDLYQCDTRKAMNAMHWSCFLGFFDIVEDLIGIKPCLIHQCTIYPSWSPLHFAIHKYHIRIVRILLESGANPNIVFSRQKKSVIARVAEDGLEEYVDLLLNAGADPNFLVGHNCPLQLACNKNHIQCVEYLLRHEKIRIPPEIKIHDKIIIDKIQRYKFFRRNTHIQMYKHLFKTIPTVLIREIALYLI